MPSPKRGRHRAPRQPLKKGAVAVPAVLLAAGGGAFAGLAGVPVATGGGALSASSTAQAATVAVALPRNTYAKDLDVLDAAAAREQQARAVAQQRARVAAAERASRAKRAALDKQAKERAAALKRAQAEAAEQRARLRSTYTRPAVGGLTSGFGYRWGRLHAGIDFGAAYGSPVRAAAAGQVVESGYDAGGYGNFVHVQHADGTVTTYNHMSKVYRRGGSVDPGDILGLVGSTGHSTGPHLHFEVRVDGRPIDPSSWLRRHGVGV